jgi:hypothetical protein
MERMMAMTEVTKEAVIETADETARTETVRKTTKETAAVTTKEM